MPGVMKEIPPVWTTGWTDVLNTGTWRSAIPVHKERSSPCHAACPTGGEMPVWIEQVNKGQYHSAWLTLVKNNPLPAITGRVCHHPCEGSCNRGEYDGAVTINALEQFIGDLAIKEGWTLPLPSLNKNLKVAVVGGGPAGLSCAYQLRMLGYGVCIFEAQPKLGGVLQYGIPGYRLPKDIADKEIKRLLGADIEVCANKSINPLDFSEMEKEYAALCLATGAPKAKILPQFSATDHRIFAGLQFLASISQEIIPPLGQQVVVIGGGSVAMDVARVTRRLGKNVKVLSLEDRHSMPAQADEIQEAIEEGILVRDGSMVLHVTDHGNQLNLSCIKVVLDPAAPAGVLKPILVPGTEFKIIADTVILAVGQDPEIAEFSSLLQIDNSILKVDDYQATTRQKVFGCGDVSSIERYVSAAIGSGKRTAFSINAFLQNRSMETGTIQQEPVAFKEINTFYFAITSRAEKNKRAPEHRLQDFNEVKLTLPEEDMQVQAKRCFSCGHCLKCDNCFYYCPDLAIVKNSSQEQDYSIQDQYCKGCGLCVEECPRGAVMLEEVKR